MEAAHLYVSIKSVLQDPSVGPGILAGAITNERCLKGDVLKLFG